MNRENGGLIQFVQLENLPPFCQGHLSEPSRMKGEKDLAKTI